MKDSATDPRAEFRSPHALSSVRVIISGSAWNVAGRGLPVVVALVVTPFLVSRLGIDRWALFTLALSLVGVAGILDFGVSRALTRSLSETIVAGDTDKEAPLVTTALWVLLVVSGAGGLVGTIFMPALVDHWLNVPANLRDQAIAAFRILTVSTPLIVVNVGLTGVVGAYQRYRALNLLVIPVTAAYFVLPALALLVWNSLSAVMLSLVLCRVAYTIGCAMICFRLVPGLWAPPRFDRHLLPSLLHIGAWIAISNTLTPMLLYADRFLIGALLPLAAVSYYATPFDVVARFTLLPIAVTGALFPAIAASFQAMPERVGILLRNAAAIVAITSFPPCLLSVAFAPDLLTLWLGADFSAQSEMILRLLACGMFFACMALVLDTWLDGTGRPDVAAKLMVVISAVFLPLSAVAILTMGIQGAAIVFMLRAAVGCTARVLLAQKYTALPAVIAERFLVVLGIAGVMQIAAMIPVGFTLRIALAIVAIVTFSITTLLCLVQRQELGRLIRFVRPGLAARNMAEISPRGINP